MWNIKGGKQPNGEWVPEVYFPSVTDAQWTQIKILAGKYATINIRSCPSVSISDSGRKLQFQLGHSAEKPVSILSGQKVPDSECETLRSNLLGCAEMLQQQNLGLWFIDRRLLWKVDGIFLFIPAFWLPAFEKELSPQAGLPPECQASLASPSPQTDIYAIASVCFRALTGREYDADNPIFPGDILNNLQPWDAVLDPALRKSPTRRSDQTRRSFRLRSLRVPFFQSRRERSRCIA